MESTKTVCRWALAHVPWLANPCGSHLKQDNNTGNSSQAVKTGLVHSLSPSVPLPRTSFFKGGKEITNFRIIK